MLALEILRLTPQTRTSQILRCNSSPLSTICSRSSSHSHFNGLPNFPPKNQSRTCCSFPWMISMIGSAVWEDTPKRLLLISIGWQPVAHFLRTLTVRHRLAILLAPLSFRDVLRTRPASIPMRKRCETSSPMRRSSLSIFPIMVTMPLAQVSCCTTSSTLNLGMTTSRRKKRNGPYPRLFIQSHALSLCL